jgi:hypothetical protein
MSGMSSTDLSQQAGCAMSSCKSGINSDDQLRNGAAPARMKASATLG